MKKLSGKTVFLTIAAAVIILAVFIYLFAPSYLYKRAMDGMRKDAGLTLKTVNIPDFKIVYFEGEPANPSSCCTDSAPTKTTGSGLQSISRPAIG